jgi:hypothetical protein
MKEKSMASEVKLLLLSEPQRFMEIVQNHDDETRVRSLHTLDDMMVCEALRHGIYNDPAKLPQLAEFYRRYFLEAPWRGEGRSMGMSP